MDFCLYLGPSAKATDIKHLRYVGRVMGKLGAGNCLCFSTPTLGFRYSSSAQPSSELVLNQSFPNPFVKILSYTHRGQYSFANFINQNGCGLAQPRLHTRLNNGE